MVVIVSGGEIIANNPGTNSGVAFSIGEVASGDSDSETRKPFPCAGSFIRISNSLAWGTSSGWFRIRQEPLAGVA